MSEATAETGGGVGVLERPAPSPKTETLTSPETERKLINEGTARVLAGVVDTKYTEPQKQTLTDEERNELPGKIREATKEQLSFENVQSLSLQERRDDWKEADMQDGAPQKFEGRNRQWNHNFHAWLEKNLDESTVPADILQARTDALKSLHLTDPVDDKKQGGKDDGLYNKIEGFRQRYFNKKKSNIKEFVRDIAEGCRPSEREAIDLGLLQQRLDSIEDILNSFGGSKEMHIMVRDYTMAYGILDQSPAKKEQYGKEAVPVLEQKISDPAVQSAYERLWGKTQEQNAQAERKKEIEEKKKEGKLDLAAIKDLVKKAHDSAPDDQAYKDYENRLAQINDEYNRGITTQKEYKAKLDLLKHDRGDLADNGLVKDLKTSADLLAVMEEAKHDQEGMIKDADHEIAHFEEAAKAGLNPVFKYKITKDSQGNFIGRPHISYDSPQGTDEQVRHIHERIAMAPGLRRMSPYDRQSIGIDERDFKAAIEIMDQHAAEDMTPDQELALVRNIQQQRELLEKKYKAQNVPQQLQEPEDLVPDEDIDQDELYKRFSEAAGNALHALDVYDPAKHSEQAFKTALQDYDSNTLESWKRVLADLTSNLDVQGATSVDALLEENKKGATVIIPYNETHFAVLKPGENVRTDAAKQNFSVQIYEQGNNTPRYIPLEALLHTELPLLNMQGHVDTKYGNLSSALIIRKQT